MTRTKIANRNTGKGSPSPCLPNEIWEMVIAYVHLSDTGFETLRCLRLVCSTFNTYAAPHVFETVMLPISSEKCLQRIKDFDERQHLLNNLLHLKIPLEATIPEDMLVTAATGGVDIEVLSANVEGPLTNFVKKAYCKRLKRLSMGYPLHGELPQEVAKATTELEPAMSFFRLMRRILENVVVGCTRSNEFPEINLHVNLPRMVGEVLRGDLLERVTNVTVAVMSSPKWEHPPGVFPVEPDYHEMDYFFEKIIGPAKHLRRLSVDLLHSSTNELPHFSAPKDFCSGLCKLDLVNLCLWPTYTVISGFFSQMDNLQEIKMDFVSLLSDDNNLNNGMLKWKDVFGQLCCLPNLTYIHFNHLHYARALMQLRDHNRIDVYRLQGRPLISRNKEDFASLKTLISIVADRGGSEGENAERMRSWLKADLWGVYIDRPPQPIYFPKMWSVLQ